MVRGELKTRLKTKVKCFGLFVIILVICMWINVMPRRLSQTEINPCKMKTLNPWDDSLKPYLVDPPPLKCSNREQLMYVDGEGYLKINITVMEKYKLDRLTFSCSYRKMRRVDGDKSVSFDPEVKFVTPLFIKSHVFRVRCLNSTNHVVYDYLHFNPLWNEDAKAMKHVENESEEKLSVIIFGIDSVSRSHALRNLPKSYKFLQEEFDTYDFEGYSKVGENTWPNLVPLLTGQSHRDFPLVQHLHAYVDSMPFLWKQEEVKRCATILAEDRPEISAFIIGGFKYAPTDYYFRPYTLGMHEFEPKIVDFLGKPSWDCYGVKSYFEIEKEYLKGFLRRYKGKRKFALFWNNQLSHEQFTILSRGDAPLLDFLQWIKATNHTQNSLFLVLSDHGYRIGGAALTHVGRAENNKPWLMLHVPKFLKTKYKWLHETLTLNTKRLVTAYDLYQTISELIQGKAFNNHDARKVEPRLVRRSLFFKIPEDRTCADAGIEERYCMCQDKLNISTATKLVQSIAGFLVSEINKILSKFQDVCHTLSLQTVTEASVLYSNADDDLNSRIPNKPTTAKPWFFTKMFSRVSPEQDKTGRYFILFRTNPGQAFFEGTVDYLEYGPDGTKSQMTIIGEPSRLDRYGNQSNCIKDSLTKPFCYCKNYAKGS